MYTIFEMMLTRKILDFVIILGRRRRRRSRREIVVCCCIPKVHGRKRIGEKWGGAHTSCLGSLEEMCKIYVWARPTTTVRESIGCCVGLLFLRCTGQHHAHGSWNGIVVHGVYVD